MDDDRPQAKRTLERIASSLQIDSHEFFGRRPESASSVREAMELLTAFELIVCREDRRACLDYVRSIAAKHSKP